MKQTPKKTKQMPKKKQSSVKRVPTRFTKFFSRLRNVTLESAPVAAESDLERTDVRGHVDAGEIEDLPRASAAESGPEWTDVRGKFEAGGIEGLPRASTAVPSPMNVAREEHTRRRETIKLPGFNAETSLYRTTVVYRSGGKAPRLGVIRPHSYRAFSVVPLIAGSKKQRV